METLPLSHGKAHLSEIADRVAVAHRADAYRRR
jgi:hypothetical protein